MAHADDCSEMCLPADVGVPHTPPTALKKGGPVEKQRVHRTRRTAGVFATVVGICMLVWGSFAPFAHGVFSTQLVAEPGQTPMPSDVTAVPEDCKGIAPTPGSKDDTTQKELNED